MTAINDLKVRILAERESLDNELKAMLVQATLRWRQLQSELRVVVGMDYLPPTPDAGLFMSTLRTIMSLVHGREWPVLQSVGFDGQLAEAWLEFKEESAPKTNGKQILELIFDRASTVFGDVGIYDWLESKSQDVDEIIRDVEVMVSEASGQIPKARLTLRTRVREIPALSTRIRQYLGYDRDYQFLGDLLLRTEIELLRQPNIGRKSVDELKEFLQLHGFRLTARDEDRTTDPDFAEFLDWKAEQR